MKSEGGDWYTSYRSNFPEALGTVTLYRKTGFGHKLVDRDVYVLRVYEPDCIVYEPGNDRGQFYAACGDHKPSPLVFFAPWRLEDQWAADETGMHHTGELALVDGRVMGTTERIPVAEIRRVGTSGGEAHMTRGYYALDPNAPDERGRVPLYRAVYGGQPDIVDALLDAGANPCARDRMGITVADHVDRLRHLRLSDAARAAFARCR